MNQPVAVDEPKGLSQEGVKPSSSNLTAVAQGITEPELIVLINAKRLCAPMPMSKSFSFMPLSVPAKISDAPSRDPHSRLFGPVKSPQLAQPLNEQAFDPRLIEPGGSSCHGRIVGSSPVSFFGASSQGRIELRN